MGGGFKQANDQTNNHSLVETVEHGVFIFVSENHLAVGGVAGSGGGGERGGFWLDAIVSGRLFVMSSWTAISSYVALVVFGQQDLVSLCVCVCVFVGWLQCPKHGLDLWQVVTVVAVVVVAVVVDSVPGIVDSFLRCSKTTVRTTAHPLQSPHTNQTQANQAR